jgi:hypothetical protein
VEREKEDADRDRGFQDRDERRLCRRLENLSDNLDVSADRRVFVYFIGELSNAGFAAVDDVAGLTDRIFDGTKVTDTTARMEMFGKDVDGLRALDDPFIEFIAEIYEAQQALEDRYDAFSGALLELRPKLMALRNARRGRAVYPDANSTMRLSVGEVRGYRPSDAVSYHFQTTLGGVMEKHTGEEPFDAPPKLIELYDGRDFGPYVDPVAGDVPVCFLTTNDITGGNSGSPVLNRRGELIGLAFDGNYESISADYQFIPSLTRSIHVDSRYVLFVVDKFSGAQSLLDELDIVGTGSYGRGPGARKSGTTD